MPKTLSKILNSSYIMLCLGTIGLIFLFNQAYVSGHSMDPTLYDTETVITQRVNAVIGMPGDTIRYENDTLYINNVKTEEPYLTDYLKAFKNKTLDNMDGYDSAAYKNLANTAKAFTMDNDTDQNPDFEYTVPEGYYFLLGDNRLISKDSRYYGAVPKENITGIELFKRPF